MAITVYTWRSDTGDAGRVERLCAQHPELESAKWRSCFRKDLGSQMINNGPYKDRVVLHGKVDPVDVGLELCVPVTDNTPVASPKGVRLHRLR